MTHWQLSATLNVLFPFRSMLSHAQLHFFKCGERKHIDWHWNLFLCRHKCTKYEYSCLKLWLLFNSLSCHKVKSAKCCILTIYFLHYLKCTEVHIFECHNNSSHSMQIIYCCFRLICICQKNSAQFWHVLFFMCSWALEFNGLRDLWSLLRSHKLHWQKEKAYAP